MGDVTETQLPGVGVRHEFSTSAGERIGVVSHRGGRRELLVYDQADPDACHTVMSLDPDDTRTLAEVLGTSRVNEAVAAVQQQVEGLVIEWIRLADRSPLVGRSIGEEMLRTKTGAYVVAVIRGEETYPGPSPEFRFAGGDVAVAVGTGDSLARLTAALSHE